MKIKKYRLTLNNWSVCVRYFTSEQWNELSYRCVYFDNFEDAKKKLLSRLKIRLDLQTKNITERIKKIEQLTEEKLIDEFKKSRKRIEKRGTK